MEYILLGTRRSLLPSLDTVSDGYAEEEIVTLTLSDLFAESSEPSVSGILGKQKIISYNRYNLII